MAPWKGFHWAFRDRNLFIIVKDINGNFREGRRKVKLKFGLNSKILIFSTQGVTIHFWKSPLATYISDKLDRKYFNRINFT